MNTKIRRQIEFLKQPDPPACGINLELLPSPGPMQVFFESALDSDFAYILFTAA